MLKVKLAISYVLVFCMFTTSICSFGRISRAKENLKKEEYVVYADNSKEIADVEKKYEISICDNDGVGTANITENLADKIQNDNEKIMQLQHRHDAYENHINRQEPQE